MEDARATPANNCVLVIFGGGGDLSKRKLFPALANLRSRGLLGDEVAIVAFARTHVEDEEFRKKVKDDLREFAKVDAKVVDWLSERSYYLSGDGKDPAAYVAMREKLAQIDAKHGTAANYLFYLATAPTLFADVVHQLGTAGLAEEKDGRWRRVVIEKPFGRDLASAQALNRDMQSVLAETQIYRIDHYLGKETVQNLLVLRFANGIFEPIWNRNYIDHIQITVAETLGVESRAGYYDSAGALRDMVPNHLFQLIALTAMEPPSSFEAHAVRNEMVEAIEAMPQLRIDQVAANAVRGQYGEGVVGGKKLPAYRAESKVPFDSRTDTFVAVKLAVDNWRWAGVPFYLRTGKRLAGRTSEIVIHFKSAPAMLFRKSHVDTPSSNQLVVRIQPNEGLAMGFQVRVPGPVTHLKTVEMNFGYEATFGVSPSTGYETLLHDAMKGEATLFQRSDMVEAGWRVVSPIQEAWAGTPPSDFPNYASGSWGPRDSELLLERDGRKWRNSGT
jgi:glucose-6-phosphate 1-dehydrogenase